MYVRLKIFRRAAIEDEGALMQDHDPGGEGFYLLRPMRGKKYRLPQRMNPFQQTVNFLRHLKIEP